MDLLGLFRERHDAQTMAGRQIQSDLTAQTDEEYAESLNRAHSEQYGLPVPAGPAYEAPAVPPSGEWATSPGRLIAAAADGVVASAFEMQRTLGELANYGLDLAGIWSPYPGEEIFQGRDAPQILPDKNISESLTQGIAQFTVPFVQISKMLEGVNLFKAVGKDASWLAKLPNELTKGALASIPVDFAAFGDVENNVVTVLRKLGIENEFTNLLAADESEYRSTETKLMNRVKAALVNMPLGAAAQGAITGAVVGAAKALRAVRNVEWAQVEKAAAADLEEAMQPRLSDIGGATVQAAKQLSARVRMVAARMVRGKPYDDILEELPAGQQRKVIKEAEKNILSEGPIISGDQPHAVPAWAKTRVQQTLKRSPELGRPLNQDVVVESAAGADKLGFPTMKEWRGRVESTMTKKEIQDARTWYSTIRSTFVEVFGEDEADRAMTGWLASNQHVDPAVAMQNMLKVRQDFRSIAPVLERTQAGLSEAGLRELFETGQISEGLGAKLLDFLDSAMGRKARTAMGGSSFGGSPFVVDIYAMRDMGYVDWPMYKYLVDRHGQDAVDAAGVKLDTQAQYAVNKGWARENLGKEKATIEEVRAHLGLTGDEKVMIGGREHLAVNEQAVAAGALTRESDDIPAPMYEAAAEHGRALTQQLNAARWLGGKLTPAEVQAIGWTAQAKRTGASAFDVRQSIARSTHRAAFEINFGEGSPLAQQFPEFSGMHYDDKAKVTAIAGEHAMRVAEEVTGIQRGISVYGPGGWLSGQQPSVQSDVIATIDAAEAYADVIGYLTQQTKVLATHLSSNGKGAVVDVHSPALGTAEQTAEFWRLLDEESGGLASGYSPTQTGIRLLLEPKAGQGNVAIAQWQEAMQGALDRVEQRLGIEVDYDIGRADISARTNDWIKEPDGNGYLQRLVERYGPEVQGILSGRHGPEYQETLRQAIEQARREAGTWKAKDAPTPPVSLGRLEPGAQAQQKVYSGFGVLTGADTTKALKIYDLAPLVAAPEKTEALLKQLGYGVKYFAFHSDPEAGAEFTLPRLKTQGYEQGNVWIYDPRIAHGSFKDIEYTRQWRLVHEASHGLTNKLLDDRYGPSHRRGRLGREMQGQVGKPPKQREVTLRPLTLSESQRAIEWEDAAFRMQRMLMERLGVAVPDDAFAREYNTNISDALYRVVSGDFGNPGEQGFSPSAAMPDLRAILGTLQNTEGELAREQGRAPTKGIDLDSWQPVTDAELSVILDERLGETTVEITERDVAGRAKQFKNRDRTIDVIERDVSGRAKKYKVRRR